MTHRIPKEMECFGSAYLETDEICILCRASEDCSKWCSRNNRNAVLDEVASLLDKLYWWYDCEPQPSVQFEEGACSALEYAITRLEELRQAKGGE